MNDPGPAKLPANVRLLGAVSLLNDVAGEIVFVVLPTFLVGALHSGALVLGWIEGAADAVASLLKLWSGGRSDRAGRRKDFLVVGFTLGGLSRPLIGLATAPWQVFAARMGDRIGKGVRSAPRDALIADSVEPALRGRAFALHQAMDHVGAVVGPLSAAAFLYAWPGSERTLLLLTVVPGAAVLALVLFGVREVTPTGPQREPVRLSFAPFGRDFWLALASLTLFALGNSSDVFLLFRAAQVGVPPYLLPVLWAAFHVVKSVANLAVGPGVDRFGPRLFLFVGWLIYAAVYVGFGLADEAWQIWALFGVYALFYGLTEPAEKTWVAMLAGPERKGLAFGWYSAVLGLAALPASVLFGALAAVFGPLAAFGAGAAFALAAAALMWTVRPAR